MRALIQRVAEARVDIAGETVSEVGNGMLILVCAMQGDGDDEARFLARKIANLRIFESEPGKMNLSILASGGAALVVSQFTLAADTSRGNRPGFSYAPRRRTKACGSTSSSQPPSPSTGCPSQPGASGRSCRSTSSTTARSRSGSIRRADSLSLTAAGLWPTPPRRASTRAGASPHKRRAAVAGRTRSNPRVRCPAAES